MKDGLYDFHFVALETDSRGHVTVQGNLVDGGDPLHEVQGQLSRAGANMLASFDVRRRMPSAPAPEGGPSHYTLKMFGSGTDTDFSVIGLGPLGLIVELRGTWRESLQDDQDAAASNGE